MESLRILVHVYILLLCLRSSVAGVSVTTSAASPYSTSDIVEIQFLNGTETPKGGKVQSLTSATSFLPTSAMVAMNKVPGGLESELLPLIIGGGSLDMKSLTKLMTSLAPKLPSLLKGILLTNSNEQTDNGSVCHEDIETFMDDLLSAKLWAINMLDASGKPGPALMKGATKFYGNFEECLDVHSEESPTTRRAVTGDTCVVSITPPPQLTALQENIQQSLSTLLTIDWHLCVPKTCDSDSLMAGLQSSLLELNISIAKVICHSEVKVGPLGDYSPAIGAIILVSILGFLVVLGTLLDLHIRHEEKEVSSRQPNIIKLHDVTSKYSGKISEVAEVNDKKMSGGETEEHMRSCVANATSLPTVPNEVMKARAMSETKKTPEVAFWRRLLLCFSAVSNGEKILNVKTAPGSLTCLNGIRVLSIGWVILGHTFSFLVKVADDPVIAGDIMKTLTFQVVINGTLSVDSFFVLSGVLVTYLFLKETEMVGGVKIKQMVMYYVHRYWRLTPAYAFMIFVNVSLVRYVTDGPTWSGPTDERDCKNNWWVSLLYVNNVVRNNQQCLGWGWYLANDMQFYVVAPLALIPLTLGRRRGMKVFGLCVIAGFLITSIVTTAYLVHDIDGSILHNTLDYMFNVYMVPWCRVGTFAIGMGVGYILHTTKRKIKMSAFVQGAGWFLTLSATLAITLSTYDENGPGRSPWGVAARTAHETLCRPVWGLVLGWVIVMCCSGKAGIIDWILSWSWWQPLARLTYGAYLIHPILMNLDNDGAATKLVHFTVANMVNRFFGYTCLSYIYAFLLAILVEAPLLQLENLVLSK